MQAILHSAAHTLSKSVVKRISGNCWVRSAPRRVSMRSKAFSVTLQLASGEVLPEVLHNGICYVVAQAGKAFEVKIRLEVDGVGVGYSYTISGAPTVRVFKGILVAGDAGGSTNIKQFQFAAAAQLPEGAPATNLDFDVGKIVVKVKHTVQGPPKKVVAVTHKTSSTAVPKLGDGKKWFLGPSLHATDGPSMQLHMDWTRFHWIDGAELERLSMRYETGSTLVLRKILDPSRPDHQRLIAPSLRAEAELAVQRAPAMAEPAPSARRAVDLTQDVRVVKPEPGIQLRVAPDELACCDLTDDDAAPSWQVHKKPRIALS